MTRKEIFNAVFETALAEGAGLLVEIESPDLPENEIIINPHANLAAKIKYYNEAYDDDMRLKRNREIRMMNPDINYFHYE